MGFNVCNEAQQIHGGYGYLNDFPLERLVRELNGIGDDELQVEPDKLQATAVTRPVASQPIRPRISAGCRLVVEAMLSARV